MVNILLKVLWGDWGYTTHSTVFFLAPVTFPFPTPLPTKFQVFLPSFLPTHPLRNPLSPPLFRENQLLPSDSTLHSHTEASQSSETAATFCSSSTLLRDLSSFQHIWMNKSQHRCYLGPNWSKPFFHFIHLFNKYLLMFVPGAGATQWARLICWCKGLWEELGGWMNGEVCVSPIPKAEVCFSWCRGSNCKPKDCI